MSAVTLLIELLELFLPLVESLGGRYESHWVPRLGDLYYGIVETTDEGETTDAGLQTGADPESRQLTPAATGRILSRCVSVGFFNVCV